MARYYWTALDARGLSPRPMRLSRPAARESGLSDRNETGELQGPAIECRSGATAQPAIPCFNQAIRKIGGGGVWKTFPAAELVPGDLVKLSLGGLVAADEKLIDGEVLLDQSMLTGESVPVEVASGVQTSRRRTDRSHGDRGAHKIRAHCRTRAHRPCRAALYSTRVPFWSSAADPFPQLR